jgi:hypothetical protein
MVIDAPATIRTIATIAMTMTHQIRRENLYAVHGGAACSPPKEPDQLLNGGFEGLRRARSPGLSESPGP